MTLKASVELFSHWADKKLKHRLLKRQNLQFNKMTENHLRLYLQYKLANCKL